MRKLLSTAIVIGMLSSTTLMPMTFAAVDVNALPVLNSATNANVTTDANNMNVQINAGQGGVGTLNWNTYNVGKDASVNYEFTAHNQTALNKVDAAGGLSQIYGKITASGCYNCGYDATGKVILINPNGVLFGDGANVNLNSFTVSTFNGVFDEKTNKLQLDRNGKSEYGITVLDGANIYGDKAVNFISDNVVLYNGSKISTNVAPNYNNETDSFGKVKIVTADGVNFSYYNNGAVKSIANAVPSTDAMTININGEIKSGNIDIRNLSQDASSEINLKGATLKATKAVSGNDGNIWLTASNNVIVEDAKLETVNYSDAAASRNGGNILVTAGKKVSFGTSDLDAVGNIDMTSQGFDVVIDKSTVDTAKNLTLTAANISSIQNGSTVNANNINLNGTTRAQINKSIANAKADINLISDGIVWTKNANITAGNDINATSNNSYLLLNDSILTANNNINLKSAESVTSQKLAGSTFKAGNDVNVTSTAKSILLTSLDQFQPTNKLNLTAAQNVEVNAKDSLTTENVNIKAGENIFLTSAEGSVTVKDTTKFVSGKKAYFNAAKDVKTSAIVDMNNIQTNINAGRDVDVKLANVGDRNNGIIAKANNNMTITTDGTLSVSSLISGKDMTINANKVIAGLPYTAEQKLPADLVSDRSYIEVGGEFTSNVATDNYSVTASGDRTDDGKFNQRHHIEYGSEEKILLVNKRPVENNATDPDLPDINGGDDKDVINPGEGVEDPTPTPTPDPTPNPNPEPDPEPTPDPEPNPDPTPNPDEEECPDVPTDDEVEEEDTPDLTFPINTMLKSAFSTSEQKK